MNAAELERVVPLNQGRFSLHKLVHEWRLDQRVAMEAVVKPPPVYAHTTQTSITQRMSVGEHYGTTGVTTVAKLRAHHSPRWKATNSIPM